VDYFHNESCYEPHSNDYFNLRYWFDASNYKPGGPVIVLQSGETSGVGRLPFLQKGAFVKHCIASLGTDGLGQSWAMSVVALSSDLCRETAWPTGRQHALLEDSQIQQLIPIHLSRCSGTACPINSADNYQASSRS